MSGGMQWLPDFLYFPPTDKIYLLTIIYIDNGKFFLDGKNHCLYEVAKQAEADCFN